MCLCSPPGTAPCRANELGIQNELQSNSHACTWASCKSALRSGLARHTDMLAHVRLRRDACRWPVAGARSGHQQRTSRAAAAPATAPEASPSISESFVRLSEAVGSTGILQAARCQHKGNGLFAGRPAAKGQTLCSVPRAAGITIDFATGSLSAPEGRWPRLNQGAAHPGLASGPNGQPEPITWDVLQARQRLPIRPLSAPPGAARPTGR